ncbi:MULTISPECIES: metalloregulator ArsR/SmtB family transcription factor [Arthrobacter]|uniref:Transcriptional regulator n=1 Tax=Arthrobacter terricola TaxID=2547396 RepID=A0A4R5KDW5_9MICC|nr:MULTISPECIES: helix-turn-helix domain-containing protein [Arthrobacter]MBT8162492.1 helix-turn-helix domain-containing protein [Arthrobacter sp. GN70]TDF93122.1 transcriptional regulator [Arthrobacter terricola]
MSGIPWLRRLSAVASLDDRNRRRLYEHVCRANHPVSRDDAAMALGLPRSTASFHLDRLVRDELLKVEFRKLGSKVGPGSGRPAKLYTSVVDEIGASVPERNYDLAGDVMASALHRMMDDGGSPRETLLETAYAHGRAAGGDGADFTEVLENYGYHPEADDDGGYSLANCPFHRLAGSHTDVVCAMNGAFLSGAAAACGVEEDRVAGDDREGYCCARIRPKQ